MSQKAVRVFQVRFQPDHFLELRHSLLVLTDLQVESAQRPPIIEIVRRNLNRFLKGDQRVAQQTGTLIGQSQTTVGGSVVGLQFYYPLEILLGNFVAAGVLP